MNLRLIVWGVRSDGGPIIEDIIEIPVDAVHIKDGKFTAQFQTIIDKIINQCSKGCHMTSEYVDESGVIGEKTNK